MAEAAEHRKKTAGAPAREGPRPFGFHVMAITTTNFAAMASLGPARLGLFPWHDSLREEAAALMAEADQYPSTDFGTTLARVSAERLELWLKGVEAYRVHPYRRTLKDPPAVWRSGHTRLLDYGKRSKRARAEDLTVLFIPSLVNPSYVLDLREGRSGMRFLRERGIRPLLIDWGAPAEQECGFDLGDYVTKRLEPALDKAIEMAGGPVAVVGYCMGGNLALALAQRRQKDISRLALLATPWDFHLHMGAPPFSQSIRLDQFSSLPGGQGEVPVDLLQIFFAMLDPTLVERKFRRFATLDPESDDALDFVAVEDWANDGMPLADARRDRLSLRLVRWQYHDSKANGRSRATRSIPARSGCRRFSPCRAATGSCPMIRRRRSRTLSPKGHVIRPPSGHVGMMIGRRSQEGLWRPLEDWLKET